MQFQPEIYAKANGTNNKLCVVLYVSKQELSKVEKVLAEIGKTGDKNIILIDASKKKSASNVGEDDFVFDVSLSTRLDNQVVDYDKAFDSVSLDFPEFDMS